MTNAPSVLGRGGDLSSPNCPTYRHDMQGSAAQLTPSTTRTDLNWNNLRSRQPKQVRCPVLSPPHINSAGRCGVACRCIERLGQCDPPLTIIASYLPSAESTPQVPGEAYILLLSSAQTESAQRSLSQGHSSSHYIRGHVGSNSGVQPGHPIQGRRSESSEP